MPAAWIVLIVVLWVVVLVLAVLVLGLMRRLERLERRLRDAGGDVLPVPAESSNHRA